MREGGRDVGVREREEDRGGPTSPASAPLQSSAGRVRRENECEGEKRREGAMRSSTAGMVASVWI
jgi:hypothetical protein